MDMETVNQIIKDARALIKRHSISNPSENTKQDYVAVFNRLFSDETISPIEKMQSTKSRNSFTKMRVAVNFVFRTEVTKLLERQDELKKSGNVDEWLGVVGKLNKILSLSSVVASAKMTKTVKARSKRHDIAGLPADWRERVISYVQKKDQVAALVAGVTGCRPAELVKGVQIFIGDGVMHIKIAGAKVTSVSGQPKRGLAYGLPSESPLVTKLTARLGEGLHQVNIDNASRFSCGIRDAGRRAYPALRRNLTAYCFRHQTASDSKSSPLSSEDISKSLGHCVDRAATRYGHRRQGNSKSGTAPDAVSAPREVRERLGKDRFAESPEWKMPVIRDDGDDPAGNHQRADRGMQQP